MSGLFFCSISHSVLPESRMWLSSSWFSIDEMRRWCDVGYQSIGTGGQRMPDGMMEVID